ncbi:hypothetical protein MPDQ_003577, partial [Monascus purpureus]
MEPNYSRPRVHDSWKNDAGIDFITIRELEHQADLERLKETGDEPGTMTDDKLLICCPTVRCFSFNEK